jgi:uncharacterized membrane protein
VNFRKLCRIACVFLLILFFQGEALAATIHGTAYEWNSFKPLNNTVIEINSTPEQYFVATNANYSFNLTPGTYLITANYFEEENLVYTTREQVMISREGEYVHDLLLFPTYVNQNEYMTSDLSSNHTPAVSQLVSQPVSQPTSQPTSQPSQPRFFDTYVFSAFVAFIVAALLGLYLLSHFIKKRNKKSPEIIAACPDGDDSPEESGISKELQAENSIKKAEISGEIKDRFVESPDESIDESPDESIDESLDVSTDESIGESTDQSLDESDDESLDESIEIRSKLPSPIASETGDSQGERIILPDDLRELMDLIKANGNRITQRELRKKSPYSESKVSLMLSDLEERGLIEKFKRGRGNIIRIPDEHITKQTEYGSKQEENEGSN